MIEELLIPVADQLRRNRFDVRSRTSFYRALALLLKNGAKLRESLEKFHHVKSHGGRKLGRIEAVVSDECLIGLRAGNSISQTLADWIPYEEAATIAAGERGEGGLHAAFKQAQEIAERKAAMKGVIVKASAYPGFLMIALGGVLYFIASSVMPMLSKMTKREDWDFSMYVMAFLASMVKDHYVALLVTVMVTVVFMTWSINNLTGPLRVRLDRLPPWSVFRIMRGAAFVYNFSTMQVAGDTAQKILEREWQLANPYMRERIDGALMGVRNGKNIGVALRDSGYEFPGRESVEYLQLIASLEGGPEQLKKYAEECMNDAVKEVEAIGAVITSVVLLLMYSVMGIVVSAAGSMGLQAANMVNAIGH
ncbi:type II secretion system F family protein [Pandoraea sp. ISTKB]|uniref:type II secretion system F family protein n=1 Tax=Pandoraea sp. ISTKB TaxID=1586708 RepID=UPI000847B105|nr:type II secretion system F family protein [Pandoraea sp. ISTKB]ODP35036.1 hypothetical protein A9762_11770 [Pandoraea sp. ISTKB]